MNKAWQKILARPWAAIGIGGLLLVSSFAFSQEADSPEGSGTSQSEIAVEKPTGNAESGAPDLSALLQAQPEPLVVEGFKESLEERMARKITLDVREMSVVDVIKFLAIKGDLNVVTSGKVQGRATFYLKSVTIKDALDIATLSSDLAYYIDKEIIRIMPAEEFEQIFGRKFNEKSEIKIIQLKYAKPTYVLSTLDNLKSALGRIIIDEDTGTVVLIDTPETLAKMVKVIEEIETPLKPFIYDLQYAKADVVAEQLKTRIDANTVGTVAVDERTNKLIIRAFPERRTEVEKLIQEFDKPTKEVLIEARILQVVFKPQYDFGIDWQMDFQDSSDLLLRRAKFENFFLGENTSEQTIPSSLKTNFSKIGIGDIDVDHFETAIRALKQVNDTKILSNPKILVTNNQEAKIHVGDTVPYIISTTSGTGDNAITSEDVRFVDVGLKLNVTPTINDDGFVTMALKPEVSTVTTTVSSKGGGIPQVNKTLVETTVMVKDGMTIILGGLLKENKIQNRKGIPLLMDIPFLKNIFSNTSESVEATEIVMFITPHIVTGDEGYKDYRGSIKPAKQYSKVEDFQDVKGDAVKGDAIKGDLVNADAVEGAVAKGAVENGNDVNTEKPADEPKIIAKGKLEIKS